MPIHAVPVGCRVACHQHARLCDSCQPSYRACRCSTSFLLYTRFDVQTLKFRVAMFWDVSMATKMVHPYWLWR